MKALLAVWPLLAAVTGHACDVCGTFLGIQPHERSNSVSLLYRYRHLDGRITPMLSLAKHGGHAHGDMPGMDTMSFHHRELYQVMELRADIWLGQRFLLLASLPVVNNYSAIDGFIHADVFGVGDPLLIGRYQVLNTRRLTEEERTVHRLLVGGGVKVPLGRANTDFEGRPVAMDQQPGTGTWDLLGSIEYMVRCGRHGGALTMIGRANGSNAHAYRMGHGMSTTAEFFRRWDLGGSTKLMPSLGVYHELTGRDVEGIDHVAGTGGSTFFTHVGFRMWWRSWGFQAMFQKAMAHDLGQLMVPNRERIVSGISYNFNRN